MEVNQQRLNADHAVMLKGAAARPNLLLPAFPRVLCIKPDVLCVQVAAINPSHPLAQMPLPPSMKNCIQLAACEANELLPMNPDLPADLFTSCLTTPIKIALRW